MDLDRGFFGEKNVGAVLQVPTALSHRYRGRIRLAPRGHQAGLKAIANSEVQAAKAGQPTALKGALESVTESA
jgi:hypothetical protein